jgi:hypothetical protein
VSMTLYRQWGAIPPEVRVSMKLHQRLGPESLLPRAPMMCGRAENPGNKISGIQTPIRGASGPAPEEPEVEFR